MRKLSLALALAIVVTAGGLIVASAAKDYRPPSRLFDRGSEPGTLQVKVDRALADAAQAPPERDFWVGYSVERLQGENSHTGTFFGGVRRPRLTIAEILAGKTAPASSGAETEDVRKAATTALDRIDNRDKPEKKVLKELGIFLKYGPGKPPVIADIGLSDLDLSFDFEEAPLYWLGKAPEDQSMALIVALYDRNRGKKVREDLIAAAGCHGSPKLALPFLERVLGGADADDLRQDAAFWVGQLNDADGLRLLVRTARSDKSEDVREGAIFAMSEVELPAAADELIALARGAEKKDVRKQAVFWLSQMASGKFGKVIEEVALKDSDIEVQEHALFALSELPDNQGLDALIKMAKTHPDTRIRKKAVFWLGESDDPRALDTIIAIIKGK